VGSGMPPTYYASEEYVAEKKAMILDQSPRLLKPFRP
jgi:hypothetical protein